MRRSDYQRYVRVSYDDISAGYDLAWTSHMRDQTDLLIQSLPDRPTGLRIIDLTCGTGYATHLLSEKYRTRCVADVWLRGNRERPDAHYEVHRWNV